MKRLLLTLVAMLAFASAARAQFAEDEKKPDPEADRQTLVNLEQGIARAIQLNSSSFFSSVFTDEFTGVTWYGEPINKAQQIRNIQNSATTYDFVRSTDIQVKLYRDVASVSSLRTERGTTQGRQFNRQFRVLRLYINTPRGWRVVAQQETQLPTQFSR